MTVTEDMSQTVTDIDGRLATLKAQIAAPADVTHDDMKIVIAEIEQRCALLRQYIDGTAQ